MSEQMLFRVEDGVAWLVMNRPEARNAMNMEMRTVYFEALQQCAEDEAIRAVVLTGTGKGFCTGADLSGSRAVKGDANATPHPGASLSRSCSRTCWPGPRRWPAHCPAASSRWSRWPAHS